jgi:ubiquinone biosynthesis protein UbiJ
MRPFGVAPRDIAPALVNRTLEREAWARTCLAAHAGRVIAVSVGPVTTQVRIDASGRIEALDRGDGAPDLTLELSPLAVPAFLADPKRWDELVSAAGDPALTATLKGLAETLPWFVERAFAETLGPIVGLRIADAGRHLLAFPGFAAARVAESAGRYAREESPPATTRRESRSFADDVAALAARVDAVAARVEALAARLPPLPGR